MFFTVSRTRSRIMTCFPGRNAQINLSTLKVFFSFLIYDEARLEFRCKLRETSPNRIDYANDKSRTGRKCTSSSKGHTETFSILGALFVNTIKI